MLIFQGVLFFSLVMFVLGGVAPENRPGIKFRVRAVSFREGKKHNIWCPLFVHTYLEPDGHPRFKMNGYELDDGSNLFIGNGWKSPNMAHLP